MGRFYGEIGYAIQEEYSPGVWREKIITKNYYGNTIKVFSKTQSSENLNDDIKVENRLSILADPFAYQNFLLIRYVKWAGVSWKIRSVEVQRPRLILTIGEVYNEQT